MGENAKRHFEINKIKKAFVTDMRFSYALNMAINYLNTAGTL